MVELLRYIFSGFVPFVGTLFLLFFVTVMVGIVLSMLKEKRIIFHIEGIELNERVDEFVRALDKRWNRK